MKLLDTTVAIDHLRGMKPAVELLRGLAVAGEIIAASEAVRFELLAGVRAGELDALEQFFRATVWVPVDEAVARAAGSLARAHRYPSTGIDDVDQLIAATALIADGELLTTNLRHFPRLAGLNPPD